MKALSSLKITRLLETKSFAVALNGLLILSICAWSLHQWLSEGISAHSLIIMPVAPNSETTSNLDRVAERANQARLLSNWHLFGELSSKPQSQTKPQAAITPTAAPVLTPLIEDSDLDLALKGLLSYDDGEGFIDLLFSMMPQLIGHDSDRSTAVEIKQIIYRHGQLQIFITATDDELIEQLSHRLKSTAAQVEIDQLSIIDGISSARIQLYE